MILIQTRLHARSHACLCACQTENSRQTADTHSVQIRCAHVCNIMTYTYTGISGVNWTLNEKPTSDTISQKPTQNTRWNPLNVKSKRALITGRHTNPTQHILC